jgi:hypothetical protein
MSIQFRILFFYNRSIIFQRSSFFIFDHQTYYTLLIDLHSFGTVSCKFSEQLLLLRYFSTEEISSKWYRSIPFLHEYR